MDKKASIRKKYLVMRKKRYFKIKENFFFPLIRLFKKICNKKILNISIYYPTNFEANVLNILDIKYFKRFRFLLPVIEENNTMNFFHWKKKDILSINRYGIPEPMKSKKVIPDIVLIPMLAFDNNKNRLGYGKGFYDKYLSANLKRNKKIITVGVAFSFQKYHKLPTNKKDFKLDYIITEKGIIK